MKRISLALVLVLFLATAAFARVNINSADAKELATLPGIGKAKAEAIIRYRQEKGNFKTIEDLIKVKGIGKKIIKKIEDEVTVEE